MVCKLAALLFVAIFAVLVQVQAADSEGPQFINGAELLLQKLQDAVDTVLAESQEALDNAVNKIDQTAEAAESSAGSEIQSNNDRLKEELDSCVADNRDKLTNLPNIFTEDLVQCVSDSVSEGAALAQEALEKVEADVSEIENVKQEVKDCGNGILSLLCLTRIALRIDQDINSFRTKAEADVADSVDLIAQLESKIKECASTTVEQSGSEGEKILETIATCLANRISR